MNLIPDELKTQTFPCPNCGEYVSSTAKVCKFCNFPLTEEIKDLAVRKELDERRRTNLNWHRNTAIAGIVIFIVGILFLISTLVELKFSNTVNFSCLTPFLLIGGIVITVKGWLGYKREKERI